MKKIYLTFDDGPSETTKTLLDILKRNNVCASFFVSNEYNHSHLLTDIAENGNIICLHSYCHDYIKLYSDQDYFFEDLEKIRNLVMMKTGQDTMIYRFPGGTENYPLVQYGGFQVYDLIRKLNNSGYKVLDWDCENKDGILTNLSADQYFENAMRSIGDQDSIIFLSHTRPIDQQSIQSLIKLIPVLKDHDYQFDTVDHYPNSHYVVNGTYQVKPWLRIISDHGKYYVVDAYGNTVLPLSTREYDFLNNKCNGIFRLDIQHTEEDTEIFRHLYLNDILKAGL